MVDDFYRILRPCQLQQQHFPLQFITGNVILQGNPLLTPGFHVGNHRFRQLQILLQHPDLIIQTAQIQVITCQKETDFLPVLLPVQACRLLAQGCPLNPVIHGTPGINHLPRLQSEIIPEMRHIYPHPLPEIPVPQPPVAPITHRRRHPDFRQTGSFCRLYPFLCRQHPQFIYPHAPALLVSKAEHLLQAQHFLLGIQSRTAQHGNTPRHEPPIFAHNFTLND